MMSRIVGGLLFYNASQLNFIQAAGTVAYTRNAIGDVSLNLSASSTAQVQMGLADLKRPFFNFAYPATSAVQPTTNELQEVFGTASGGPSNPYSGSQSGNQFLQPAIPWGIAIVDVFALYSVQSNILSTAPTLGVSRVAYVENTAITITALIAATNTATAITAAANACHVATVAATTPLVFETVNFSDILPELIIATQAGTTARVYGMGLHVAAAFD